MKNTTLCSKILHFVVNYAFCGTISHFCGTISHFCDTISHFVVLLWYICGIFVIYLWYFLLWVNPNLYIYKYLFKHKMYISVFKRINSKNKLNTMTIFTNYTPGRHLKNFVSRYPTFPYMSVAPYHL